jgi:hypothetical protein
MNDIRSVVFCLVLCDDTTRLSTLESFRTGRVGEPGIVFCSEAYEVTKPDLTAHCPKQARF